MYGYESGRRNNGPVSRVQAFPLKVQMAGILHAVGKDVYVISLRELI